MEILGQRIRKAVEEKKWKAYKIGKDKIPISHMFFADDLLLFGEASQQQAEVIFEVLETFCVESGQKVNGAKSMI